MYFKGSIQAALYSGTSVSVHLSHKYRKEYSPVEGRTTKEYADKQLTLEHLQELGASTLGTVKKPDITESQPSYT